MELLIAFLLGMAFHKWGVPWVIRTWFTHKPSEAEIWLERFHRQRELANQPQQVSLPEPITYTPSVYGKAATKKDPVKTHKPRSAPRVIKAQAVRVETKSNVTPTGLDPNEHFESVNMTRQEFYGKMKKLHGISPELAEIMLQKAVLKKD